MTEISRQILMTTSTINALRKYILLSKKQQDNKTVGDP